jgi:hypothetical protein
LHADIVVGKHANADHSVGAQHFADDLVGDAIHADMNVCKSSDADRSVGRLAASRSDKAA